MFNHIQHNSKVKILESFHIDGHRYYHIDNALYSSVTSIISLQSNEQLLAWRQSIGEEVANFESKRAAYRGSNFHKICENYLLNNDVYKYKNQILAFGLFYLVKQE